jgi:hypothetical protein
VNNLYISLLIVFAAFGAFCFNLGHKRAYRVVFKGLLKGQIGFLSQRSFYLTEHRAAITQEELAKAQYSYETIGQLVIGWHKYFGLVREDKELRVLKAGIKSALERYLSAIESLE